MKRIAHFVYPFTVALAFIMGCCSGCADPSNLPAQDTESSAEPSVNTTGEADPAIPSIVRDSNKPLEVGVLDRDGMYEITRMLSVNNRSGMGGRFSLYDVIKITPVLELRECCDGAMAYSVHSVGKGRFYIFYEFSNAFAPLHLDFYSYSEKVLHFSDFDTIQIGVSTIDDVAKIDSTTGFIPNQSLQPQEQVFGPDGEVVDYLGNVEYLNYSVHMTTEGAVIIGYEETDGVSRVAYIDKRVDTRIAEINPLDRPS